MEEEWLQVEVMRDGGIWSWVWEWVGRLQQTSGYIRAS